MTAPQRVDCYAVVGNPVGHSLSPRIHHAFAEETGQAIQYTAIELPVDGFFDGITELREQGYRGVNVTVPFKREAWEICDHRSQRADFAGAVNTLVFAEDGSIYGDNTDGVGLIRDLVHNLQIPLQQRKVLILGAGGAVRGVLEPLLAESPQCVTIANRTLQKAEDLARDFTSVGKIEAVAYTQIKRDGYHVMINATAAGLSNQVPPVSAAVLDPAGVCYDMMYNLESATAFVEWSRAQGVKHAYDGLGMLVEQAAEAFKLWRDMRPQTGPVLSMLRAE